MLTRSVIGFDPPEGVALTLDPFNWEQYPVFTTPTGEIITAPTGEAWTTNVAVPAVPTVPEPGFDWSSIWGGVKDVLTTGAEVFGKVYPAITGKGVQSYPYKPGSGIPIDPRTGQPYQIDPRTGQIIGPQQAGLPAWVWPVVAGIGGFILINSISRR